MFHALSDVPEPARTFRGALKSLRQQPIYIKDGNAPALLAQRNVESISFPMVTQERKPAFGRPGIPGRSPHPTGNGSLGKLKAQTEELD